jgi:hypothetical protein
MITIRTISTIGSLALLLGTAPATQPAADCCATPSAAVALLAAAGPATQPAGEAHDAAALFDKLAGLAGTWTGEANGGAKVKFEYTLTGGGTTLVENQDIHGGMMTMYSLDGDRVVMTHYCGTGNQPRMAASGLAGETAEFKFVDATGMKDANDAHMHELAITFAADGTLQQDWTLYADGKPTGVVTIKLKKSV